MFLFSILKYTLWFKKMTKNVVIRFHFGGSFPSPPSALNTVDVSDTTEEDQRSIFVYFLLNVLQFVSSVMRQQSKPTHTLKTTKDLSKQRRQSGKTLLKYAPAKHGCVIWNNPTWSVWPAGSCWQLGLLPRLDVDRARAGRRRWCVQSMHHHVSLWT